ncbi:uncharacterized protein [Physcomitrium patens]|uniref:uncharacterized protein n=1 Tax=Physcomitrium patens TaxID=3218 RepID=UPI003CCDAFCC
MIGNHRDPGKEHSQDDKIEREKLGQKKIMTFKCCQKKATRACVTKPEKWVIVPDDEDAISNNRLIDFFSEATRISLQEVGRHVAQNVRSMIIPEKNVTIFIYDRPGDEDVLMQATHIIFLLRLVFRSLSKSFRHAVDLHGWFWCLVSYSVS